MTCVAKSRPSRGAWIEIVVVIPFSYCTKSRAPRGARGLKYQKRVLQEIQSRRAPRGARGLKYFRIIDLQISLRSRPSRGAWIEICDMTVQQYDYLVAPLAGRVD